jgi:hypothetical protein
MLLFYLNFFNGNSANIMVECNAKLAEDIEIIRSLKSTVKYLNNSLEDVKLSWISNSIPQKEKSLLLSPPPDGVALLLMTDQPKWFQRRYSLLIQNLLSNLPLTWKVQIFHPDSKQYHAGVDLNPGFKRLIESKHPRLHLTKLPSSLVKARKRPIHIMLHPFVWENTLAEKYVITPNSDFQSCYS